MRKAQAVLAGFLSAIWGCLPSIKDGDSKGNASAVAVPTNDPLIDEASQQARSSLDQFISRLSEPRPNETDFSIKVPIEDGGTTHFLWLNELRYDGNAFGGVLGADASALKAHSPGEPVKAVASHVADWMYVEDGKLVGGFSLRAIRSQLSGDAREQFEKNMWFKFE